MILRVLLAIPDAGARRRLGRALSGMQLLVTQARKSFQVRRDLQDEDFDLVVLSRSLLGDEPSDLVRTIQNLPEQPEIVVVSESEDAEERARLLALGCMAVLNAHLPGSVLADTIRALARRRRETIEHRMRDVLPLEQSRLEDFVTASPAMRGFMDVARKVVRADSSLLLTGETGVGKERLARAIHAEGPRSKAPFVAVNCAAVPETLLESELFGHERGAFTGAVRSRRGYFELAHRGTLFLDEIGEMPLHLQAKLLHVLQGRTIQRIGSESPVPVDVRVMAATNRNLEAEVQAARFRADLYYRLSVVTLTLPPLRERTEDVPALVEGYLAHFRAHLGRSVTGFTPQAMEALVRYAWPGNVRELINAIERAVLLCSGPRIGLDDLPRRIGEGGAAAAAAAGMAPAIPSSDWSGKPIRQARGEAVAAFERAYLSGLLETTRGKISETARLAGINERSLFDLMRRHGLRKEIFKR